jgi:hypothetical protein
LFFNSALFLFSTSLLPAWLLRLQQLVFL